MKTFCTALVTAGAVLLAIPSVLRAEFLIYQLPEDGSWVRFDAAGEGIGPDGEVQAAVDGTLTISSVGRTVVDGEPCRWIELNSAFKFKGRGREAQLTEVFKLLIPEKHLKKGEDPRAHILKAYKKDVGGEIREIDLEGDGVQVIRSLDEILSRPLRETRKLPALPIDSKLGELDCEGWAGREVQPSGVTFTTETRVHDTASFGVVTHRYEKERADGSKRTMTFTLADFGANAQSALPESG